MRSEVNPKIGRACNVSTRLSHKNTLGSCVWRLAVANDTHFVFVLGNLKHETPAQSCSPLCVCRVGQFALTVDHYVVSKRQHCTDGVMLSAVSLIAIINSATPSADRCGIPFWISVCLDRSPLVRNWIPRISRKLLAKADILPVMFLVIRELMIPFFHTTSWSSSASELITVKCWELMKASHISVSNLNSCSVVKRKEWNPLCRWEKKLLVSRNRRSRLLAISSINLHIAHVYVKGL